MKIKKSWPIRSRRSGSFCGIENWSSYSQFQIFGIGNRNGLPKLADLVQFPKWIETNAHPYKKIIYIFFL